MRHHLNKNVNSIFLWLLIASVPSIAAQVGEPSRQPILRVETGGHTAPIKRISVDAANRYFVTASDDKTARVWELPTGRLLHVLRPPIGNNHDGKVFAVAISPDGETVAVGGWTEIGRNPVFLFARSSGRLVRVTEPLPAILSHLTYSRDGKYLAVAVGGNAGIRVFETTNYSLTGSDPNYSGDAYGADFDSNGRMVTCALDGFIRLYQVEGRGSLRLLNKVAAKKGRMLHTVRFSPDGSKIALGVYDAPTAAVLSAQTLSALYFSEISASGSYAVEWSPDGSKLYMGIFNGVSSFVRIWERAGQGKFRDIIATADSIIDVQSLNDGGLLFCTGDAAIGMVDPGGRATLLSLPTIANLKGNIGELLLSPDSRMVQFVIDTATKSRVSFSLTDRRLDTNPFGVSLRAALTLPAGFAFSDFSSFAPKLNGVPLPLEPNEIAFSYAGFSNGQGFVLGTGFAIRFFDNRGSPRGHTPTTGVVWAVNASPDGKFAVALLGDGTVRWYSMADGKERLALFPHPDRRRWVLWTPSGYYDASPGAEDFLGWHINNGRSAAADFFPVSQFRDVYYRPDVISLVLQTGDEALALKEANEKAGRKEKQTTIANMLPPIVEIISPADGAAVSSTEVKVRFRVRTPSQEAVTRIKTLVEGRPTGERQLIQETATASGERELTVSVPERDTEISVIAENRFAASVPATLRIRWAGKAASNETFVIQPKLYVLAVGVSKYANPNYSLEFAAKDARDFAAAMARQKGLLYRDVVVKVLADETATKDEILDGLDWIRKETTSKDVAMVFFAGHGINDQNGSYYFLPHNTDVQRLLRTGVPFTDIRTTVQSLAGKTLFFIDTCHSGNVLGDTRRRDLASDLNGIVNELASAENGAVVFAASTGNQYSLENKTWNNGAFTKALVEGLLGKADYSGKGKITINMLDLYLSERVKELTGGRQTPTTAKPRTVPDFPVAVKQ